MIRLVRNPILLSLLILTGCHGLDYFPLDNTNDPYNSIYTKVRIIDIQTSETYIIIEWFYDWNREYETVEVSVQDITAGEVLEYYDTVSAKDYNYIQVSFLEPNHDYLFDLSTYDIDGNHLGSVQVEASAVNEL